MAGGGAGGGFARQGSTPRGFARRGLAELRSASQLRVLPLRVAWFQWRARRIAKRTGDRFSLDSVTRPANLGFLLRLAQGRRQVVELDGDGVDKPVTGAGRSDARSHNL